MRASVVGALYLILIAGIGASAQENISLNELSIEDLLKIKVQSVFGASKFLQKVTEAPAAVSVVTRRDIELYGFRTLTDVLASAHGFNVTYDRNYGYVGVRGFQRSGDYNTRILVLVDGHRANDSIYDMASIGTEFPVDLALVERIELIRGPSSSIYGTNAFFAVVNVVTRKGGDLKGFQVSSSGGSLHTTRQRATFGNKFANGLEMQISGSFNRSRGQTRLYFPEYDSPSTNNGVAENADSDANKQFFASASFRGLSVQGLYGFREKTVPTGAFEASFNDARFQTSDGRGWLDVRYEHALTGNLQLTARAYYDTYNYEGRYPGTDYLYGDYAHEKWWGAEVNLQAVLANSHKITAGAEYRDNFSLKQAGFNADTLEMFFGDTRRSHVAAAFIEDQFTLSDKVLLNAGVRHDRYPGFGGTTNPRLALIYKPLAKTSVKVLWGTAFRAPNGYELFYDSTQIRANPNLDPETINTTEVVGEHYFARKYRFMVSVYRSQVEGLIDQVTNSDGDLEFRNLTSATTSGFEGEFEGKWRSGIGARVSYSYQNATDVSSGMPLANSAKHLASGNLTVPVLRRALFLGADVHFVGPVQTLNGSFTRPFVVPGLTMTTREFRGGFSFLASVRNLTNTSYGYPGSDEHRQNIIIQDGRTFEAGLKYTFHLPGQ